MPKLTKEQLAAVKYVSIKDFCTRIDQLEDMKDKLDFATRYILSHGMGNEQPDAPIEKIIKVAQMKIADQSADIKTGFRETDVNKGKGFKMVDPNVAFYGNDVANQMFIVNPVGYLKGEARRLGDDIGGSWMSNEEIATKAHYGHLRNDVFTNELASKISDELQKPTSFDVQVRLENKLGGPAALKKAVDATKPGVLSGFFGTRSVAAANLDAAYKAFNNPNHVLYGNLPSVEKASTQYLQHVFPNWKPDRDEGVPGNLPTEADINRLSGTRKARALFSLNLLNAAKEQEKMEASYKEMYDFCKDEKISYANVPDYIDRDKIIFAEEQQEFQKQVSEDSFEKAFQNEPQELDANVEELENEAIQEPSASN